VDWRLCDPAAYDLLLVRTTWDYVKHQAEFLDFLQTARAVTPLENPLDVIAWNLSKRYLLELIDRALPVIPSVFVDTPTPVLEIFDTLGADELVLKPVVGAGGFGQSKLRRSNVPDGAMMPAALFAQPLIPDIMTDGEISMIFVDGAFSPRPSQIPSQGRIPDPGPAWRPKRDLSPTPDEILAAGRFRRRPARPGPGLPGGPGASSRPAPAHGTGGHRAPSLPGIWPRSRAPGGAGLPK